MLLVKKFTKEINFQTKLYAFVLFGVFGASLFQLQSVLIFCLLLFSVFCIFYLPQCLIFLYTLFIPTNDIFPKEQFLFGVLGIKQVLGLSILFFYLLHKREIDEKFRSSSIFQQNKWLLILLKKIILLIIVYWIYVYYKNAFLGLHEFNYQAAMLKTINTFIFLFSLIPYSKLVIGYMSENHILKAVTLCVFNMFFFAVLSPYLPQLGFKAIGTEATEFSDVQAYERYVGVIADGDSNTLGVFFSITVSFLLIFAHKFSKFVFVFLLASSLLTILLTGSRTAFISVCLCIIYFYIFINPSRTNKAKHILLVFLPIFLVLALPFLQMVVDRLSLANEQLETDTESNRIGKWIIYFNFFLNNPETFIGGAIKELKISWDDHYYAAHNVFITMVYNSGLLFPIIFLYYVFLLLRNSLSKVLNKDYVLLIIPFFALIMTVSDLGILFGFVLFSIIYIRLKSKPIVLRTSSLI